MKLQLHPNDNLEMRYPDGKRIQFCCLEYCEFTDGDPLILEEINMHFEEGRIREQKHDSLSTL